MADSLTAAAGLRVAQLIDTMGMGGAEHLAVQIANARAAAGDASHLYVMTEPGVLSARISPSVQVRYLRHERAPLAVPWRFLPSLAHGYRLLRGQLRADRIAVLQTHLPGANFWGLLLALRGCCAVIATVHNNQEFLYGEGDSAFRAGLRRRAYGLILRRCAAVVAVSEEVRRSLLEDLAVPAAAAARLLVVPNGVQVAPTLAPERRHQIRARYDVEAGDILVLTAGRLSEQKDQATLIRAVARLDAGSARVRLLIAGDGPLRDDLARLIQELSLAGRARLLGTVTELPDLMGAADLFVLSSRWEGLPLVLLEAMAHGLPVIGCRIRGIQDVVSDGEQGLLVPAADPDGLAAAIRDLAADPVRRDRLGRSGRALVEREYSFDRVAGALGRLYRQVASP
jgi:glycosyltransferase involved in cell wall biosynthesis